MMDINAYEIITKLSQWCKIGLRYNILVGTYFRFPCRFKCFFFKFALISCGMCSFSPVSSATAAQWIYLGNCYQKYLDKNAVKLI